MMTARQPDTHPTHHRPDLHELRRSRWFQPALAIALGVVLLVVASIGGHPGQGTAGFAVMVGFAIFLLAAGRSDSVRALRGDGRDERFQLIQLKAATFAARLVLIAAVVGFLVEIGRGNSGSPYSWLSALGGASFLAATLYLHRRD
jgi:hypothetical protein